MSQQVVYRVPRRFITPPQEPPPYGLLALSFTGHVLAFLLAMVLSSYLGSRIDQSKIYIVNLVPAAPSLGSPLPPVDRRPTRPPELAKPATPPPPTPQTPKIEERTPPRPTPARLETPPPKSEPVLPRTPPPPDVVRAAPLRPAELALPRRVEKEAAPLETPGTQRFVERALPPPPAAPPPSRAPEAPPRVASPPAPPLAPSAVAASATASVRPGVPRPDPLVPPKGGVSLDVSDFPFTYYLRLLHGKVAERWRRPPVAGAEQSSAVIVFEIDRDGSIKDQPKVKQSSGNELYDQSAVRAIVDASPFPPLPPEFKASSLRVNFGFDFRPDQG